MTSPDEILEAARTIRPVLDELILDDAPAVDDRLADLLARATAGEQVADAVVVVLAERPQTDDWLRRYLAGGDEEATTKGYSGLPGPVAPVGAQRYECPQGDVVWYRRYVGQQIPTCRTHQILLVLTASKH